MRQDWYDLRSDDREVAYVWSTEHKYAGCPISLVRLEVSKLLLTLKLLLGFILLLLLTVVTALVTAVGESFRSVLSKWQHTDMHLTKESDSNVT